MEKSHKFLGGNISKLYSKNSDQRPSWPFSLVCIFQTIFRVRGQSEKILCFLLHMCFFQSCEFCINQINSQFPQFFHTDKFLVGSVDKSHV